MESYNGIYLLCLDLLRSKHSARQYVYITFFLNFEGYPKASGQEIAVKNMKNYI